MFRIVTSPVDDVLRVVQRTEVDLEPVPDRQPGRLGKGTDTGCLQGMPDFLPWYCGRANSSARSGSVNDVSTGGRAPVRSSDVARDHARQKLFSCGVAKAANRMPEMEQGLRRGSQTVSAGTPSSPQHVLVSHALSRTNVGCSLEGCRHDVDADGTGKAAQGEGPQAQPSRNPCLHRRYPSRWRAGVTLPRRLQADHGARARTSRDS